MRVSEVRLHPRNRRQIFRGVCALNDQACTSSDPPPPPHNSWIASYQSYLYPTRFLPLTAVNVYSLLQYLVLGNKLQSGGNRPSSAPIGTGYAASCMWTSENPPSTTPVNKGKKERAAGQTGFFGSPPISRLVVCRLSTGRSPKL